MDGRTDVESVQTAVLARWVGATNGELHGDASLHLKKKKDKII